MNATHGYATSPEHASRNAPVVFVVDGDAAVRDRFRDLLRPFGWQTMAYDSGEAFMAQPRERCVGCLVAEVTLPGCSGLELQRCVADRAEMPVIFMAGQADVRTTVAAMKAGAIEFFTKPLLLDLVVNAIRQGIARSEAAVRRMTELQVLCTRYESLSLRERQVMSLVVAGRLNKQIGGELGISEITVKAHRGRVMRKMEAGSLAELVTMAASLRRVPSHRTLAPVAERAVRRADAYDVPAGVAAYA